MARNKKNDFWDDYDDPSVGQSGAGDPGRGRASGPDFEEDWSPVKSTPIKVIFRLFLMVACFAALLSGYIAYEYIQDRYAGGGFSNNFYNSRSFAEEYNKSVDQIMQLIQAVEDDPTVLDSGNEELMTTLVENYMGKDTNFSFLIQDSEHFLIASSGEDAKDRIEASNHYALITNASGEEMSSTISGRLLNKTQWQEALDQFSGTYVIYTAVDNELTHQDAYYRASQTFAQMEEYFNIARFAGIAAVVIFIICLIFCIMATGMKRGYENVQLSWFDKIPTEIALVIMAGIGAGLIYADYRLFHMEGDIYRYATLGGIVVTYIWIIRCYFSIVRRFKSGRFVRYSLIGIIVCGIGRGINKLPSPLNVIVTALCLIAINAALVAGIIFGRQYVVNGIPVMFIVAPVVLLIELIGLLSRGGGDDAIEDYSEQDISSVDVMPVNELSENSKDIKAAQDAQQPETAHGSEDADWENIDLGSAVKDVESKQKDQEEGAIAHSVSDIQSVYADEAQIGRATVALSVDEVQRAIRESGMDLKTGGVSTNTIIRQPRPAQAQPEAAETESAPETAETEAGTAETAAEQAEETAAVMDADEGKVNFVQLNKDVRKEYRQRLRSRGVSVTVRAPEKPVIIDIDRDSLHILIADIFSQIEKLAADETRAYLEIYLQGGKVAYIVRMTVAESAKEEAVAAAAGNESFDQARKIVEANDGKFVISYEGNELKVGVLMDAAE